VVLYQDRGESVADLYFLGFCTASFISFEIALDNAFWARHKARSVPLRRREAYLALARAGSCPCRRLTPPERLAGLAQLVEQLFCKHQVTGSNPVAGTSPNILLTVTARLIGSISGKIPRARPKARRNALTHRANIENLAALQRGAFYG
jgi:hypothetical protein